MTKFQKILNKILKLLLVLFCLFIGAIVLLVVYLAQVGTTHYDLIGSTSPDQKHRIEVKYSTAGSWPYGPHSIHIYLKTNADSSGRIVAESKISNDGKQLRASNCVIDWVGSVAVVQLNGEEQDEEVIKIDCKNMRVIYNKAIPN